MQAAHELWCRWNSVIKGVMVWIPTLAIEDWPRSQQNTCVTQTQYQYQIQFESSIRQTTRALRSECRHIRQEVNRRIRNGHESWQRDVTRGCNSHYTLPLQERHQNQIQARAIPPWQLRLKPMSRLGLHIMTEHVPIMPVRLGDCSGGVCMGQWWWQKTLHRWCHRESLLLRCAHALDSLDEGQCRRHRHERHRCQCCRQAGASLWDCSWRCFMVALEELGVPLCRRHPAGGDILFVFRDWVTLALLWIQLRRLLVRKRCHWVSARR